MYDVEDRDDNNQFELSIMEKWLRCIEIKRLYYPENSKIRFELGLGIEEIESITVQMIDYSIITEDWRFLNTALKLHDLLLIITDQTEINLFEIENRENKALMSIKQKMGL